MAAGHHGPASGQHRLQAAVSPRIGRWMAVLMTGILLAGCADRPGPQSLLPVMGAPRAAAELTVFTATDRALAATQPPVYGGGRGPMTYERYVLDADEGDVAPSADAGFAVVARQRLDRAGFLDRVGDLAAQPDHKIVVFVHGYNNSYQEAVFRLADLAREVRQQAVPVLFSWPSEATVTGYVSDRDSVAYARGDLADLLTDLTATGRPVVLVGHSMGGWLVMETLRQLRLDGRGHVIAGLEVGLVSPDIDLDVFRTQVMAVGRLSPPLTVLTSPDDRVLAASARVAGGRTRLGAVRADDPQMRRMAQQAGVRLIDISALPASDATNHDRMLAVVALRAAPVRSNPLEDLRQTGAYVLGGAGRLMNRTGLVGP